MEEISFEFTKTLKACCGIGLQLQEVELYGPNGKSIAIRSASNPGGSSIPLEGPEMVVDGDTTGRGSKWLDQAMPTNNGSLLVLRLTSPATLGSYAFYTAGHAFGRNPVRLLRCSCGCMCGCVHTHVHMCLCQCRFLCTYACACVHLHVCTCACAHAPTKAEWTVWGRPAGAAADDLQALHRSLLKIQVNSSITQHPDHRRVPRL